MTLTLDLGAIAWRVRRAWRHVFGHAGPAHCVDCNARLSPDEREHYGSTCERCEGDAMRRLEDA